MAKGASISVEIEGRKEILRAFKALGETNAPFLRHAVDKGADLVDAAASRRAQRSIGASISNTGVKGKGAQLTARVVAKHPGAVAAEFGRTKYYEGFTGRAMKKTGRKVTRKGQKAEPYFGIKKGDAAAGEVGPKLKEMIGDAFEREFERLAKS